MTDTMISRAAGTRPGFVERLLPDPVLGYLSLALLAAVLVALARGRAEWHVLPWPVWAHLATMIPVLAMTPLILRNRKGDRRHRQLGYVWVVLLAATALVSFAIRLINDGGFSWIHILSAWVLIQLVLIVRAARTHRIVAHRARIRGMVMGALLIAGFFTFPFGRLMGRWLFG